MQGAHSRQMQSGWPTPDREELTRLLEESDDTSFQIRLDRVVRLRQEFGPPADMFLVGGMQALWAWQEMQNCYFTENCMAVVLLAHAFVEHTLAGGLILGGEDETAEGGFARVIRRALEKEQITPALFERLDRLRKIRNSYVHPKVGLKQGSVMDRLVGSGLGDPRDLVDEDAWFALQAVVECVGRTPTEGELT
jgi:hypothetical protein